jgi:hypothetical protein
MDPIQVPRYQKGKESCGVGEECMHVCACVRVCELSGTPQSTRSLCLVGYRCGVAERSHESAQGLPQSLKLL